MNPSSAAPAGQEDARGLSGGREAAGVRVEFPRVRARRAESGRRIRRWDGSARRGTEGTIDDACEEGVRLVRRVRESGRLMRRAPAPGVMLMAVVLEVLVRVAPARVASQARALAVLLLGALWLPGLSGDTTAQVGPVSVISLSAPDTQTERGSSGPAISSNGRWVAFQSIAALLAEDTNEAQDIYVRDRRTGQVERVSVDSAGGQAIGESSDPVLSRNGRFVAFVSDAANLVEGDSNGLPDVFVHDRKTGTTVRASVASDGGEADGGSDSPMLPGNGRFVAFDSAATNLAASDTNGVRDVFLHDLKTGVTELVSAAPGGGAADGESVSPSVSANGRFVAFVSLANNFIADDGNGAADIYLADRTSGSVTRVSVGSTGQESNGNSFAPVLSDNGRLVVYVSAASNLVAGDDNGVDDVVLRDLKTAVNELVSVPIAGGEGAAPGASSQPSLSSNGRLVAFLSAGSDQVAGDGNDADDVFVRDRKLLVTQRLSTDVAGGEGAGDSLGPRLSGSGKVLAFSSFAEDLVPGDNNEEQDVFARNMPTGKKPAGATERLSVFAADQEADGNCDVGYITPNARFVTFASVAESLAVADPNGTLQDVFLRDRKLRDTLLLSQSTDGAASDGLSQGAHVSDNGRLAVFRSAGTTLVAGDGNAVDDIFLRDVKLGTTRRVSVAADGTEANGSSIDPQISGNGRIAVFTSQANNLVAGDGNGVLDIFAVDLKTNVVQRMSVASNGGAANAASGQPSVSANGRYVAFASGANNLVVGDSNGQSDVFVHDRQTLVTQRVSVSSEGTQANAASVRPHLSANGRLVLFVSNANNLVAGDTNNQSDVFVHDRTTGVTVRVSVASDGQEGNALSSVARISPDGRYAVYNSFASNFAADDTNGAVDVYRHDLKTGATLRVSVDAEGLEVPQGGSGPSVSSGGRFVAFQSQSDALAPSDANGLRDVLLKELE